MVRRFPILFRSCMCLPSVSGEMAGSSWVVSQKPSHLLPSTLLTSPNPPKPPDPPDPPPRRRCLEALVTTSSSHSPHPILEAALAKFSLDKGHICTLFSEHPRRPMSPLPFNLMSEGYLSDHFYGDFDFPCFKDGVRLVLTFFVAKDSGKFEVLCDKISQPFQMGLFMEDLLKASIQLGSSFRPVVSFALVAKELALKAAINAALAVGVSGMACYSDWQELPLLLNVGGHAFAVDDFIADIKRKRKPDDDLETQTILKKHKETSEEKETTKDVAEQIELLETKPNLISVKV
ncbi:unnamed protein product [Arabidopsis arenosa]|uniref:Uncharacterized protein n=1 Tax=Arabidopsis arenosa TaxID=38785 RepID=A0A8S2AY51_ARAAE|nr:unnamed protein product [Arabidopsis arenosa]